MKKLFVIALLALAFGTKAQTIASVAGNTGVNMKADGTVEINGQVKGYITQDGTIKNAAQVVIGHILQDGTIQNAANTTVGFFMSNYDVHDASHNVIGHLRTNLDVKTAANVKIGTYTGIISPIWSAVAHFFFKLN